MNLSTQQGRGSGLPASPHRLIGREAEQHVIHKLLTSGSTRLLTLCGSGGIGKTRLALEVARNAEQHYADGVRFVDLTAYREPAPVVSAIAASIRPGYPRPSMAALERWLEPLHLLLVIDNFEQVLEAAPLVAELVAGCPRLTVLVTSRAPLNVSWEHVVTIGPLDVPRATPIAQPAEVLASPAVALFLERTTAAGQGSSRYLKDLAGVAEICRRLDGIPLALELAAARTRVLSPSTLLSRLDRMLDILTGGPRDRPARHQALRSAFDWSYDLLKESDRRIFRGLGIFVGGCSLESATRVCDAQSPTDTRFVDAVARLVDTGLVASTLDVDAAESRLNLLEPVREYALNQLQTGNDYELVAERHANMYLELAERAEPEMRGPRQRDWLVLLEREHGNLLSALRWFFERGAVERGLRMVTALGLFWWASGYTREGLQWLQLVLAIPDPEPPDPAVTLARANAMAATGVLLFWHAEIQAAEAYLRDALALYDPNGDMQRRASALNMLGHCAVASGQLDRAQELYQRSRDLYASTGDRRGVAQSNTDFGVIAFYRRDYLRAEALLKESVSAVRAAGDTRGVAMALRHLAMVNCYRGDIESAHACLREALLFSSDVRDRVFLPMLLEAAGIVAVAKGECVRGLRLAAASATLRDDMDMPIRPTWKRELTSWLDRARAALGHDASANAWADGLTVGIEDAIREATAGKVSSTMPSQPFGSLTRREGEVLRLLAGGHTNKEIAAQLQLSVATVERHIANVYGKIGARGRADAVAYALTHGVLPAERG